MTPRAEIRQAAADLRDHSRAVPGFCPALPDLLEACADLPGTGDLALAVAHSIRPPRRRTGNRTNDERNEQ